MIKAGDILDIVWRHNPKAYGKRLNAIYKKKFPMVGLHGEMLESKDWQKGNYKKFLTETFPGLDIKTIDIILKHIFLENVQHK